MNTAGFYANAAVCNTHTHTKQISGLNTCAGQAKMELTGVVFLPSAKQMTM